jgi:hypothetical protein
MKIELEINLEEIKYIVDWIESKDVLWRHEHQLWHLVEEVKSLREELENWGLKIEDEDEEEIEQ